MEVDPQQAADDLAGRHPPGEEGQDSPEEERGEDGPQGAEGLQQARRRRLDVLLRILALVLVLRPERGRGRDGEQRRRRGHAGGFWDQAPGEVSWDADKMDAVRDPNLHPRWVVSYIRSYENVKNAKAVHVTQDESEW